MKIIIDLLAGFRYDNKKQKVALGIAGYLLYYIWLNKTGETYLIYFKFVYKKTIISLLPHYTNREQKGFISTALINIML